MQEKSSAEATLPRNRSQRGNAESRTGGVAFNFLFVLDRYLSLKGVPDEGFACMKQRMRVVARTLNVSHLGKKKTK